MKPPQTLVIPRWEWRTLAPSLADLRERLGGPTIETVREIEETYLLCMKSSHNAKIRGEQLDLKWRKQVSAQGLELWDPILKAIFPLDAEEILQLFGGWGMTAPILEAGTYDFGTFLAEVIQPNRHLRAVRTEKVRRGFTLDGTTCELVELRTGSLSLESFCVEHEDPGMVMEVLRRLGLDRLPNTNYPQGLKRALAQRAA